MSNKQTKNWVPLLHWCEWIGWSQVDCCQVRLRLCCIPALPCSAALALSARLCSKDMFLYQALQLPKQTQSQMQPQNINSIGMNSGGCISSQSPSWTLISLIALSLNSASSLMSLP